MTDREILRRAKEALLERGHHQGEYAAGVAGDGPVCLRGALGVALTGHPYSAIRNSRLNSVHIALWRVIEANGGTTIIHWNDAPGRTLGEVVDVIDRALALLPVEDADRELVAA